MKEISWILFMARIWNVCSPRPKLEGRHVCRAQILMISLKAIIHNSNDLIVTTIIIPNGEHIKIHSRESAILPSIFQVPLLGKKRVVRHRSLLHYLSDFRFSRTDTRHAFDLRSCLQRLRRICHGHLEISRCISEWTDAEYA
jgi:ribosomal protein S19